jgi:hypothetical protein
VLNNIIKEQIDKGITLSEYSWYIAGPAMLMMIGLVISGYFIGKKIEQE